MVSGRWPVASVGGELAMADGASVAVCVVVPVLDEVENLEAVVRGVLEVGTFSVLIVDDASTDGTAALADRLAAEMPDSVFVMHRDRAGGLGGALRAGFSWVLERRDRFDACALMDGDGQHPAEALPRLIGALRAGADMAIGSRYVAGASLPDWSLTRRAVSRLGNGLARRLLGLRVRDVTSGLRAFRMEALAAVVLSRLRARANGFFVEQVFAHRALGHAIVEVPFAFGVRERGRTKLDLKRAVLSLMTLARLTLTRLVPGRAQRRYRA